MKTAAIIGNGSFPEAEYPRYLLDSADVRICCDGALVHMVEAGIVPDAVVGDMDSLPEDLKAEYAGIIVEVPDQDTNDQTKALKYLLEQYPDVDSIHFLGATGRREDHTIGNMSLLMEYERMFHLQERGIDADMVSDYSTIFAVTDSCTLDVGEGRSFSIFTPDTSLRISSEGLQWPLDDVVFDNWWKAELNRASADRVSLVFSHPSVALVVIE